MPDRVQLLGVDMGTTTCSAVVAHASLQRTATGRVELDDLQETYRSDMVFTPLTDDDRVDLGQVERLLDTWLAAGSVQPERLFGGGALLTGLTAQKENAAGLVRLLRRRLGQSLVATADDPCLESWLAFLGSCGALSRQHPQTPILNFDIGGGTTNIALGRDRQVLRTGCLFIGARHVQVVPGSYSIIRLSAYATGLFDYLHITKRTGETLTAAEVDAIVDFYVSTLEDIARGIDPRLRLPFVERLEQVRLFMPAEAPVPAITLSGGVGELVYRHLQGEPWPSTTHFGDLGIDLAQRLVRSPVLAPSLRQLRPASGGRATVYGLLQHNTEVSGSTLFMRTPGMLPLADLPIFGCLSGDDGDERLRELLALVRGSSRGGCVQIRVGSQRTATVRRLGERLAHFLEELAFATAQPVVLLVQENVGKVLGQYATRWGTLPVALLVIDEITQRDAHYGHIGAPQHEVVPVVLYGLGR